MQRFRKLFCLSAVLSASAIGTPAGATVLYYDGFAAGGTTPTGIQYISQPASTNGSDNNSLIRSTSGAPDGQAPPTLGFTGGWRTQDQVAASVYGRIINTGLTYPGIAGPVGAVDIARTGTNSVALQLKRYGRALNNVGAGTSNLYFSQLLQFDANVPGFVRLSQGTSQLSVGFDANGQAYAEAEGGTLLATANDAATSETTHLLVGKVSGSTLDLWLNPTDLTNEANNNATKILSGVALPTFTAGAPLTDLLLGSNTGANISNPNFVFDEVRGATTWQEATTGVPEPTTAAVVLGGVVLLGLRRRVVR